MTLSLTACMGGVEKVVKLPRIATRAVRSLSLGAALWLGAAPSPAALAARPVAHEELAFALRGRWQAEPASASTAVALAEQLLHLGRREEACRTLLSTYALTSSAKDRQWVERRVQVISRVFLSSEAQREYQAGLNLLTSGEIRAARARFEQVLSMEPAQLDTLVRKGQAEALLGFQDSAAETFRLARAMSPFEAELRLWLGHLLLTRGERDEGTSEVFSAWKMADAEQRSRPHWKAWYAEALIVSRRIDLAKALLESALRKDGPQLAPSSGWYFLGLMRLDHSQRISAKRFLNLFPSGYIKLAGASGLGLNFWDPALLESEWRSQEAARLPGN